MTAGEVLARPLLSVEEALDAVLAATGGPMPAEHVPPVEALGRVLAEPVSAATSLPPWDNSAMDGYAVRAEDVAAATGSRPVELRVIGEVAAGGEPTMAVEAGSAIRIATGAPVPPGADAVVPVEQTDALGAAGAPLAPVVAILEAVPAGGSIRRAGSDVGAGTIVIPAGAVMTPSAVALAAGVGAATVVVHARPVVAVLATGDELRLPDEPLGAAGIPNANGPGLLASVTAAGGHAVDLGVAIDQFEDVVSRLRRALDEGADVIVVSGGVSVGPYDVVKAAFEAVGTIDLWRVAVQPGKPFAFGVSREMDAGRRPALLFGLPGNPVSSLVTFELFVRPALRRLLGHPAERLLRPIDHGVLREHVSKSHGRRAFLRVVAERDSRGTPARDSAGRVGVRLAGGQGSHVLSAIAAADALAIVPESDDELPAGAPVELWWLDGA